MATYYLGEVIRRHRKERKITQEELADGICTAAALSMVENGERTLSKTKFEAIIQRLGYSFDAYDFFVGDEDMSFHERRFEIIECISEWRFQEAGELLDRLEETMPDIKRYPILKQFVAYARTLTDCGGKLSAEDTGKLEDILRITVRGYGKMPLKELFLSKQEITILNNIAISLCENGRRADGITLFYDIKDYMELKIINSEEKMRLYPPILYNLSKYLGLDGRYEECVNLCNYAIDTLVKHNRTAIISHLTYNKVWCMMRATDQYTKMEVRQVLLEAYFLSKALKIEDKAIKYKELLLNRHPELEPILMYGHASEDHHNKAVESRHQNCQQKE